MTMISRPEALVVMAGDTFELQFDAARLQRLSGMAELGTPLWTDSFEADAVAHRLADVEVLVTSWGSPRLSADRLARLPRLRAVFHCAGSVRTLVSDEFWARDIVLTNAADINAIPVAEFTLAAIILAGKKAPFLAADARHFRDDWTYSSARGELSNHQRTVGIVGYSRIGRRVVKHLESFTSLTCLVADPHAEVADVEESGAELVSLDELLTRVDTVSLHAPALPSTRGMIGAAELALLREHATVINTARGSLIDTAALERECRTGRINAILDVTDPEPLPRDSVLYELPNVMLTPHIAGSLGSETLRMTDAALDELELYVAGAPQIGSISADVLGVSA